MRFKVPVLLALGLASAPFTGSAQFFSEKVSRRNGSLQFLAGAQNYLGDLMPDHLFQYNRFGSVQNLMPCGQFGFGIQPDRFWSVDVRLFAAQLRGDESQQFEGSGDDQAWHRVRGIRFKSLYADLNVSACFEPLYLFRPLTIYTTPFRVSPFIRAGVGVGVAHVKRDHLEQTLQYAMATQTMASFREDLSQDPTVITPVFPVGVGFKVRVSPTVHLLGEGMYRMTLTDYLDGTGNWNSGRNNDGIISYSVGISCNLAAPTYYTPYPMVR